MEVFDINLKAGAHIEFSGKISDSVWKAINCGMYATQIFMGNPYSLTRKNISQDDINTTKKLITRFPMNVFSHFPYVANLCGSVKSLAWNGDEKQDEKTEKVISSIEHELGILSNFSGVVIHPGSFPDKKKGLKAISETINKINFPNNSKLILENSAGEGTTLATTFNEIKCILDGVVVEKRQNIGVCIDTCHLFAYGDYNLSKNKEIDKMFTDFDNIIGLEKLSLFHLNDSKNPLGSKTDRHELLKNGYIWSENDDSLKYLLQKTKILQIPMILETDVLDMYTLAELSK